MSDFKNISIQELCKQYPYLDIYLHKLEKKIKSYEEGTSSVYSPNKPTYKELEDKIKNFEIDKNREIDELWATKIKPLREKVELYEKSLELTQSMSVNDSIRIKELQGIIKDQQTIINYAAGYISACEQFRDKHPNDVVKWLFKGLK